MENIITDDIKKESLKELKRLIEIPSVNKKPDNISIPPFGVEITRALQTVINLCDEMGMETFIDPEGFYGYADYGEGDETVGVLCHLDVAPAGKLEQWQTEPFKPVEKEGWLYGRGTQDDKGPTIAALYGFKAVKDNFPVFKRKIRFIFGLDEEHYWRSISMYKKNEKVPDFGFVPDASFPLVKIEKHLLRARLIGPGSPKLKIESGGSFNAVPDTAVYRGENTEMLRKALDSMATPYDLGEDGAVIVHGKSTHAQWAQEGINAITALCKGLMTFIPHPTIGFIGEKVGLNANGENVFGPVRDEVSGELTFNVAGAKVAEDHSEILLDMRLPFEVNKEEYVAMLKKEIEPFGLEYEEISYLEPFDLSEETELVNTLLEVYRDKTGDDSEPVSTGGASYARSLKNFAAFGALFPGREDRSHAVNEVISIEDFYLSMDIYAEAIYRLCVRN